MDNVCCTQKDIYLKYEFVFQVSTLVLCITGHFKDKGGRFKANMKLFAKAIGKRLDWFEKGFLDTLNNKRTGWLYQKRIVFLELKQVFTLKNVFLYK